MSTLLNYAADAAFGERGLVPHPVALYGRAVQRTERFLYRPSRAAGVVATTAWLAPVAAVAAWLPKGLVLHVSMAGRSLRDAGTRLADLVDAGDIDAARSHLRTLCGRDAETLDRDALVAAGLESVAENTVDAVVAPLFWAALAGAPGAAVHRAVNTLDAMVGHRSPRYERFGWAAAKLDDLAAWVPARLTAVAVQVLHPRRPVLKVTARDAKRHPSPNAGVAEAAFAAGLGVKLGGPVSYEGRRDERPVLNADGRPPTADDLRRAVRLSALVGALASVVL